MSNLLVSSGASDLVSKPKQDVRKRPRYAPVQLERLTGLPAGSISRWLGLTPQNPTDDLVTSFFDLVECLWVCESLDRGAYLVDLVAFRESCRERGEWDEPSMIQTFRRDPQSVEKRIAEFQPRLVRPCMEALASVVSHLEFDRQDLPVVYHTDGFPSRVVIDPSICWGAPIIQGTRVNTDLVWESWKAEGEDASAVARDYDLIETDVRAAIEFQRLLDARKP